MASVTSQEFIQNAGAVKRAADSEVVFITDGGRPSHVLMSVEMYDRLRGRGSLYDALAMAGADGIDFEAPRVRFDGRRPDLG